jgi:hypothetical protein
LEKKHTISPDGYDVGRDRLVQGAVGTKSYGGVTYRTTAQCGVQGLLKPGSAGINHGKYKGTMDSVGIDTDFMRKQVLPSMVSSRYLP